MTGPSKERRKHPRAGVRGGLRLRAGDSDCTIVDISCSGVRFLTANPPPLMSMLEVRLEIPRAEDHDDRATVSCQGAVVRTEAFADEEGSQEVAVFFTWMNDADRLLVSDYVRRHSGPKVAP